MCDHTVNTTTAPNPSRAEFRPLAFVMGWTLLASGCSTFPERMSGTFESDRGDFLVVKPDGALYWSPPAQPKSTTDTLIFVGVALQNRKADVVASIVVPPDSPFQHSNLTFTPDHDQVLVDWGGWPSPVETIRSTEYERAQTNPTAAKSQAPRSK